MNRTQIISKLFLPRLKELTKYETQAEELQTKVLKRLIVEAQHTEWGKTHNFSRIKNYEAYRQSSPVNTYG